MTEGYKRALRRLASVRLLFLGTAQDGGVPHIGCRCPTCQAARDDPLQRRLSPSVAIVEREGPRAWLLDASPDLPEQLELVREALGATDKSGIPLSAILLTHGHMGHVWGLGYLGKEGMMPRNLPVFAPPGVVRYLRENRPFKDLVEFGAIDLRPGPQGDPPRGPAQGRRRRHRRMALRGPGAHHPLRARHGRPGRRDGRHHRQRGHRHH
jgi:glyoxylase-like metal-dependent hydrolase (beta-lactamase superfamily II)